MQAGPICWERINPKAFKLRDTSHERFVARNLGVCQPASLLLMSLGGGLTGDSVPGPFASMRRHWSEHHGWQMPSPKSSATHFEHPGWQMPSPMSSAAHPEYHGGSGSFGHVRLMMPHLPEGGKLGLVVRHLAVAAITDDKASQLGFHVGDRILAVNDAAVSTSPEFYQEVSKAMHENQAMGVPVVFDIWRRLGPSIGGETELVGPMHQEGAQVSSTAGPGFHGYPGHGWPGHAWPDAGDFYSGSGSPASPRSDTAGFGGFHSGSTSASPSHFMPGAQAAKTAAATGAPSRRRHLGGVCSGAPDAPAAPSPAHGASAIPVAKSPAPTVAGSGGRRRRACG